MYFPVSGFYGMRCFLRTESFKVLTERSKAAEGKLKQLKGGKEQLAPTSILCGLAASGDALQGFRVQIVKSS